ncbi:MAG: SurA N-terminal domain-containing protein [Chitinophagaceae bacterium]|nr:SurA N-terminal domain-containing protein [Chitinophagaceae bacterium]
MSIIQTIRDKGAAIVIGVIALSLIGFLLMDARSGASKGLFGGNTTTLGSVNGKPIENEEFDTKVKAQEQQNPGTAAAQQNRQQVWDQMVAERVVTTQFEKLGIAFTPKEVSSIMFSDDAPQQLKQAFTDPNTGQYDIAKAQQWWSTIKKSKSEEQRDAVYTQVIDPMRISSLYNKYTSMIAGSIYTPAWLAAKQDEETRSFSNISYVAIPYSEISDSAVKVTDDDIKEYIENNKLKYKQEAGRMLSYVSFNAAPNTKDSAFTRDAILALKNNLTTDTNAKAFIARNNSAINFFDGYTSKTKIQVPNKDSIINLPDGGLYGPYLDGTSYVIAKKVSTKILPDSIKCRHILLGTNDPQSGQQLMPDSIAKQKIDSIEAAIKGGADFNALEEKYSTDKAAQKDKGVMTFDLTTIQGDGFAKEFGDFLLNEKGETKKVVHTQFGWHYIEILEKKNPGPAYKIAYMAREIVPSDETVNAANAAATKLSGEARDIKQFDAYIKQNGLKKTDIPTVVKENDYQLGSLPDARQIIKWSFGAKDGEVSEPYNLGEQFVVAVVTKNVKEGIPDPATARPNVEAIVRNRKKADIIKKKLGTPSTLEAAAAVYQKQVLSTGADSTLTLNAILINGVGNEPRVAGAAFNKDFQTKVSPPIAGNTGVFVLKINSVALKPQNGANQPGKNTGQDVQSVLNQIYPALKKMADITDKRSKFF